MYRKSFRIAPAHESANYGWLLEQIAQGLEKAHAHGLVVRSGRLRFRGGICRVAAPFDLLQWVGWGEVFVQSGESRLEYRLSFWPALLCGTFMAALPSAIVLARHGWGAAWLFGFLWLCTAGAPYAIALNRFNFFLRRCIRDAGFVVTDA